MHYQMGNQMRRRRYAKAKFIGVEFSMTSLANRIEAQGPKLQPVVQLDRDRCSLQGGMMMAELATLIGLIVRKAVLDQVPKSIV